MSAERHDPHSELEALRRTAPPPPARRPWLGRATGILLVVGLLAAAYAALKPVLFPPRIVTLGVVRPVQGGAEGGRHAATVQAAGWVEADPYPITVRPLVPGVVQTLHVLEGSPVTKDETVIAVLRNAQIENALVTAQAQLIRERAVRDHRAETLAVARSLLKQNLMARVTLAARQGELATARAEVDHAAARRKTAEAALERAQVDLDAQLALEEAGHATPSALAAAKARVREAEERVKEVRFDEVRVVAELARVNDLLELAREAVREPRDLEGAVTEAQAALTHAEADVVRADADLRVARTNAELLTLKAPITGLVMRLGAAPGSMVGPDGQYKGAGEGAGSTGLLDRHTGAVCWLYDPAHLQVRVDVPFAELPGLEAGCEVELEARVVPGRRFKGVVDRLVREADITQAKLQLKVRILEPDVRLAPEMLVTAKIAVRGADAGGREKTTKARALVPEAALRVDAVFVFDPTGGGRARRVPVRVVQHADGWVEVEGAIGPSSKLILDDVEDGEAVREAR